MKLLQATVSLVFLLACSMSDASDLHDACQSFAAIHYKDADYNDCVKFFQAKNESATADRRGLAVIGAKIIDATAKSTGSLIATMLTSEKKNLELLRCLITCGRVYLAAMDEIDKAAKGIVARTDAGVEDAVTALGGALDAALDCEDAFQKLRKPSPLAAEDARFRKETSIALFMTWTLLPKTNSSKLGI